MISRKFKTIISSSSSHSMMRNNEPHSLFLRPAIHYRLSSAPNNSNPDDEDKRNRKQEKEKEEHRKREEKRKMQSGMSLFEIYEYSKREATLVWNKLKQASDFKLFCLFSLPFFLYYLSSQEEAEEYPVNYFEMEIQKHENYSELDVIIKIRKKEVNYRVEFSRNNKRYFVTYYEEERFKKIIKKVSEHIVVRYKYQPNFEMKLTNFIIINQIIGTVFITAFFLRSSSMGGVKKSSKGGGSGALNQMMQKKEFEIVTKTNVKFDDVAGLNQSKMEVKQFVDFLKNPEKYKKLGARIPKGVLLSGPPGTGKTMLGKACAGEAGVPFIPVSGSDFVQIFAGVGASRVRDMFELARQKSPAIIFIDQIDAVGRKRSGSHGSHDERDNTLNQILVEMDGFGTDSNVIVMAATNRPNLLDSALVRPGRFDRMVEINLPDLEGRREIFLVHLEKIHLHANRTNEEYARRLATLTPGFSGAEIANLCNQAAILAARNGKLHVDSHDLEMATERIIGGIERKSIISTEQKRIVAVHESGHAAVSWYLEGADPLLKLTIIPRSKGSLGFAQYFVNETKLNTRSQLIDRICFILGGRCAEEKFFNKITNGASDDLKKAYQIAHSIVVKLGMSEQIGYIGYKDPEYFRPYSEEMAQKVDTQIKKIITECTQRTRKMVDKYYTEIKNLSDELYDKETLTIRQIRRILGERDFTSNDTYNKYLEIDKQMAENAANTSKEVV